MSQLIYVPIAHIILLVVRITMLSYFLFFCLKDYIIPTTTQHRLKLTIKSFQSNFTIVLYFPLQVLYHLFEGYTLIGQENIQAVDIIAGIGSFVVIVIGAPGIGIVLGFLGGFLSRFTHHVRIMEPLIVIVICYMSFLICEMFHLSGILGLVLSVDMTMSANTRAI